MRRNFPYHLAKPMKLPYPDDEFCTEIKEPMTKVMIAQVIQDELGCSGQAANATAGAILRAIVTKLRRQGSFTLAGFGAFHVKKTRARIARNPRTQEMVNVKAGRTVRFRPSPKLRKAV